MPQPGASLPAREQALFKRVLKCYEQKQYKHGLKFIKQIMNNPKCSDHGETLAMKGLILNCLGKKDEAYDLVKKGLRNHLTSPICWHVYGLLQRSDRKYDEAIRCYIKSLQNDPDNIQILRDLSLLQVQMRDLQGYKETRQKILSVRPTQKNSWIGFALAAHLVGNYDLALRVIEEYKKTQTFKPFDLEESELLMYECSILIEAGRFDAALDVLEKNSERILDRTAYLEQYAELLLKNSRIKDAHEVYEKLLDRNPENKFYYEQLAHCIKATNEDGSSEEILAELYEQLAERYPRASVAKLMVLANMSGAKFRKQVDSFLRRGLRKGVPGLANSLKSLYDDQDKVAIIESVALDYLSSLETTGRLPRESQSPRNDIPNGSLENGCAPDNATHDSTVNDDLIEPPTTLLWTLAFLAQHFDRVRDRSNPSACLQRATSYIDRAIDHTPTVPELYMMKGRFLKHGSELAKAVEQLDMAQSLDTADRFINCKCAKYLLRDNRVQEATDLCGKFTREGVSPMANMNEMQCMWFQLECAAAYYRLNQLGEALKKCHEVDRHFNEFVEDQFDFHSYCQRKVTLTAYMRLLRMEDAVRDSAFFARAAKLAVTIYLQLHDNPSLADQAIEAANPLAKLSAAEQRKIRNKERKKQKKAASAAGTATSSQGNAPATSSTNEPGTAGDKNADHGKVDPDEGFRASSSALVPEHLVKCTEPLKEACHFLRPLIQSPAASQSLDTNLLAFNVYDRLKKPLAMLQCINRAMQRVRASPSSLVDEQASVQLNASINRLLEIAGDSQSFSTVCQTVLESQLAQVRSYLTELDELSLSARQSRTKQLKQQTQVTNLSNGIQELSVSS